MNSTRKQSRLPRLHINSRLVLTTLIVAAVVLSGGYLLRQRKFNASADLLLDQADRQVASETFLPAAETIRRYLKIRPGDTDATIRLAETYTQGIETEQHCSRAVELHYEAIGVASGDDAMRLRSTLCDLLLKLKRYEAAEIEARNILDSDPDHPWGKRAAILAMCGKFQSGQKFDNVGQLRMLSAFLVERSSPGDLQIAADMMQSVVDRSQEVYPSDRMLLASLLERQSDLPNALQQLSTLANQFPDQTDYLMLLVLFQLNHGNDADAEAAVRRLETLNPDDLQTIVMRCRLDAKMGQTIPTQRLDATAGKRMGTIESPKMKVELCRRMGNLFSELGDTKRAEDWHTRLMALDSTIYGPLALTLARNGKLPESWKLCQNASDHQSARAATIFASSIVLAKLADPEVEPADPMTDFVDAAIHRFPEDADLLSTAAGMNVTLGNQEKARDQYERVIAIKPNDADAHNNLAMLLADDPESRDQGVEHLRRALALVGDQPHLIETMRHYESDQ